MDSHRITEILRTAGFAVPAAGVEQARARSGARVLGRQLTRGEAESAWRGLLALRRDTGFHPLLSALPPSALVAGSPAEPDIHDPRADTAPHEIVAEITAAALTASLAYAEDEDEAEAWRADFDPERLAAEISGQPEPAQVTDFRPEWLCLVETGGAGGWSVPGILPGYPYAPSWEHGPDGRPMLDSDHAAFLHAWQDRFGAELMYLSDRTLLLDVAHPPRDPLAVAATAIEQYAYCPDGNDTTSWANRQTRRGTWQFTWD
ncbi:DUF4253 domain-containing protein [Streptomyces sp. NPDC001903]|uniref:DUF4253 domain-containing protein n=1 Tax=Streptomyces sp. NPDC001903 TaxID=3364622 RepID=UPI0036AD2841